MTQFAWVLRYSPLTILLPNTMEENRLKCIVEMAQVSQGNISKSQQKNKPKGFHQIQFRWQLARNKNI